MQSTAPILSLSIWVPILAGLVVFATGGDRNAGRARMLALAGSVAALLVTLPLLLDFNPASGQFQFVERFSWIERFHMQYYLGVDGISMLFVPLTAFITVLVVLAGWEVIETRVAQ
jgi:NADH-quinone oxidoreductase subunit M